MKLVKRQYRATPIIQINKGHKRLAAEFGLIQNKVEWVALYKQRQAVELGPGGASRIRLIENAVD